MSKQAGLKVRFSEVKNGWMTVCLSVGENSFSLYPGYTPYDSIEELVRRNGDDRSLRAKWQP